MRKKLYTPAVKSHVVVLNEANNGHHLQLTGTTNITKREDAMDAYLKDISKYTILTSDEEAELVQKALNGSQHAKDKLVASNLKFVVSVAKQYEGKGVSLSDLVQEGNIGLIEAIEHFNPHSEQAQVGELGKTVRFVSFAIWYIRKHIHELLLENSHTLRLTFNMSTKLRKINKLKERYMQLEQREPTIYEIAEAMGMSEDEVITLLRASLHVTKLDAPAGSGDDEGDVTYGDKIASNTFDKPDAALHKADLLNAIKDILCKVLIPRDAKIVMDSVGIGCEAKATWLIAEENNLTETRVLQIIRASMEKLRHSKETKDLTQYLG